MVGCLQGGRKYLTNYLYFSSYRECGDPGHYIHENFFCDGQPNCATDGAPEGPLDEAERACATTTSLITPSEVTPQGEDIAFGKARSSILEEVYILCAMYCVTFCVVFCF